MKSAMFSHNISNWIRILSESGAEYDMVQNITEQTTENAGGYQDAAGLTDNTRLLRNIESIDGDPSIPIAASNKLLGQGH